MAKLHLFAHMDRNKVREGDKVIAYKTELGTVGTGNGQYWAHLHHSISEGLTPVQLLNYVRFWSREKIQKYYSDPAKTTDYKKMFGRKMDVGNRGWGWLQRMGLRYYHPGQDINGLGGGNTDLGYKFTSPVDGTVIYEWRGWGKNMGWGNIIIVKQNSAYDCDALEKKYQKAKRKYKELKELRKLNCK